MEQDRHFKPSYENMDEAFIPCFEVIGGDFKLKYVSQVLKTVIRYPAEIAERLGMNVQDFEIIEEENEENE